jgi:hypothetical protein
MSTKTKEVAKTAVKEPVLVPLKPKQRELMSATVQERMSLEQAYQKAQQKESDMTTLILDANDIDLENVDNIQMNEDLTVLTVHMK